MFQYQFMKWLELEKKCIVYPDFEFGYGNNPSHYGFEFNRIFKINLKTNFLIKLYSKLAHGISLNIIEKITLKLIPKLYIFSYHKLNFTDFDYCKNTITYFDGYWQSYKYNIQETSFFLFYDLYKNTINQNSFYQKLISTPNSVSLHIRGGDYQNDANTFKLLGNILDQKYYQSAISRLNNMLKNPTYFIFSDDIEYANKILKSTQFNFFLIDNLNLKNNYFLNIYFMSICENNIISNSTFALWGALLNKNHNKIVIAPKLWINNIDYNIDDILPSNYIKI